MTGIFEGNIKWTTVKVYRIQTENANTMLYSFPKPPEVLCNQIRKELGRLFAEQEFRIETGNLQLDHVHMLDKYSTQV